MNLNEAVAILDQAVPNPADGLPDEVFYYVSRTTPLINVDLLIKDEKQRTLLAWRNDSYCGAGWHVPGGIVRFKETMDTRIRKVAEREIGRAIEYEPNPIKITEMIVSDRANRSHFISFLFACRLPADYIPDNTGRKPGEVGFLQWHDRCPDNLIREHEAIYRPFIENGS